MRVGYRRRQSRPEDQIQRAVFEHIRQRGVPGIVAWHTPNGGKRRPIEAAILKGLGVRAGVADVCIVHDGAFYALELKAEGGRSTEAQIKFRDDVNAAGGYATEAHGLDAALRVLEVWQLLRGSMA